MAPKRWGKKKSAKSDTELTGVNNGTGYVKVTSEIVTNNNQSSGGSKLGIVWFKWKIKIG